MVMEEKKSGLFERYEVTLMAISLAIIAAVVFVFTVFPEQGNAMAGKVMYFLTHTLGSPMQVISALIMVFLVWMAFSKYGDIRLGKARPEYKTVSWVAMMFFCGQGAGTVYWAFLEWGYHFNAAPMLHGVAQSEAYHYELALAYAFYDWGPLPWALLCIFVIPFAYHYHIKKDNELRFSALCKYTVGEKRVKGLFGKLVDFIFIFSAVGSICITAGTSASTIAAALASLLGIPSSFALSVIVLLGVAALYSLSSVLGIENGMRRISDGNIYFCCALLALIIIVGPGQFILDSFVNAIGIMLGEFVRMTLWTDPVAQSSYPQDWTVFYMVYWFVFGPFTGLFVAKISKGRKLKAVIANMLITGSLGLFCFFGIITAYQQKLRIDGILDIPGMLASGKSQSIAEATLNTFPFSGGFTVLYLIVIVLFLATTLDATAFALSSTVSKGLKADEEPKKALKFVWCLVLVCIPLAITFAGTDINTIKAIVLATGMPLVVILAIAYHGLLKEMKKDFGPLSRSEILEVGDPDIPGKELQLSAEAVAPAPGKGDTAVNV